MTRTLPTPKPGILSIAPYVGGKSKAAPGVRVVKLSSNETPLGPSPKAKAAFAKCAESLHRYPDGSATALREAIAEATGLPAAQIICGAGSDELIGLLVHAYAGAGDEVLIYHTGDEKAIVGLAKALDLAQEQRQEEARRLAHLQKQFIDKMSELVPSAVLNGSLNYRLANNLHYTFPGIDNETLMMQLDERGIMCAVGSACSASNEEPSHVLKAIGLTDAQAQASLRFTMGRGTNLEQIDQTVAALQLLLAQG